MIRQGRLLPSAVTSGLWRHVWRPVTFTLVVDDFGIKFTGETHANHLIQTLKKDNEITTDPQGQLFVGIKLKWDYDCGNMDTHVPNYVPTSLNKYQHPTPSRPQHAPAKPTPIQYGAKIQTEHKENSPSLSTARVKRIQDVVGTFAWYARASDPTMARSLSSIASHQYKGTEQL